MFIAEKSCPEMNVTPLEAQYMYCPRGVCAIAGLLILNLHDRTTECPNEVRLGTLVPKTGIGVLREGQRRCLCSAEFSNSCRHFVW